MAVAQRFGSVTLVHCGGELDCNRVHKWFRVRLDPDRVRFVSAGIVGTILGKAARKPIMKYALAMRYARRIASEFDLVVGSYGECPIPTKHGIQYINVPIFSEASEFLRYLNTAHDGFLRSHLRPVYVRASRWLSGWSLKDVTAKRTLVNSLWTADVVQQLYGISGVIVAPATDVNLGPSSQDWTNWIDRELGFVMLGRIHPSKRLELGIQIIQQVRKHGHDVNLHIIGRGDDHYVKKLKQLIVRLEYVHLHLNMQRPELEQLVAKQKFGLHACEFEHYGIAAAEMQALGCVVFAPDFAGQREVVANAGQRYVNLDDAVKKICELLENPNRCKQISDEVLQRGHETSTRTFEEQIGAIFAGQLEN